MFLIAIECNTLDLAKPLNLKLWIKIRSMSLGASLRNFPRSIIPPPDEIEGA
jgi:hypothetical protein